MIGPVAGTGKTVGPAVGVAVVVAEKQPAVVVVGKQSAVVVGGNAVGKLEVGTLG